MGAPDQPDIRTVTALLRAIYAGDPRQALALIKPGLSFDSLPKDEHQTPLVAAIENKMPEVVQALLEAGADIHPKKGELDTPLHAAVRSEDEALVSALLDRGAAVDGAIDCPKHTYHGRTPLMQACCGRSLPIVKVLLERGANPLAKDGAGLTALNFAEFGGKRIQNHVRKAVSAAPQAAALGLFDAARAGLVDRVRELLDGGVPADEADGSGVTALEQAIMGRSVETVRLLLDRGASPTRRGQAGFSPLTRVDDDVKIVEALLQAGADPNARGADEMTDFHYLAMFRSAELLGLLIDHGTDLQARTRDGRGVLDFARTNRPTVRRMLKNRLGLGDDAIDRLRDHMRELKDLASGTEFLDASKRLGELFGRKPTPWQRRKGVIRIPKVSLHRRLCAHYGEAAAAGGAAYEQASQLFTRLQDEVRSAGFTLIFVEPLPDSAGRLSLLLLPTSDQYAALLACGTNGINKGHDVEAVIRWLMDLERENPFQLGGCGYDFLDGRLRRPPADPVALAARMIEFCPDMVDQADEKLRSLSRPQQAKAIGRELSTSGWFRFWWD